MTVADMDGRQMKGGEERQGSLSRLLYKSMAPFWDLRLSRIVHVSCSRLSQVKNEMIDPYFVSCD